MNETIIQIVPTPSNLVCVYGGGTAQSITCFALVEPADGDHETGAVDLTSGEIFEEWPGAILFLESGIN